MQTRRKDIFTTVHIEGSILPPDLLQRIAAGDSDLGGLDPLDYHLAKNERLNEAINRSWNRLLGVWATFTEGLAQLPTGDLATSFTRERWLLVLFQELGFGSRLPAAKAIEIGGKSYPISHGWQHTPIHLVSCRVDLDHHTAGVAGAARTSPHSLVQEFLNRSQEHLWGFVSNGLVFRILRENVSLIRSSYVEFDLMSMMDSEIYADFVLLWLLCHQSRVDAERPEQCWLEKWSRNAQEQGTRVLEQLRKGVEEAISVFGRGFLTYLTNRQLRATLQSGELSTINYYRQILRLVYRLIFLFVAEDRGLLLEPEASVMAKERYNRFYSTARLRHLAELTRGTKHPDLFQGLRIVMQKLGQDGGCPELGLPALGSFLWSDQAIPDLTECDIANHDLLEAIRALAFLIDSHIRRPVDYKNLGSEELGSIYESLLEMHPILDIGAGAFELTTTGGSERKTTGSYYTPTSLINCLLDSALNPVLEEAVKQKNPEDAILNLKVCDPACGSGHFLIAAAHRIAKRLATVRTGDEEPAPKALHKALRDVIGRCIYGVDINEMAVELCKVSLWMDALEPGKPLSFLDHRILCGNSLLGATPALLKKGIPDQAFNPIEGDLKEICADYKKINKKEREGSLFVGEGEIWPQLGSVAVDMTNIVNINDTSFVGIHHKEERYQELISSKGYLYNKLLADTWCAAFVWKKTKEFPYPITEEVFRRIEENPDGIQPWMLEEIQRLAQQYQFFHWYLAFPDVFLILDYEHLEKRQAGWSGGFNVVLGNPPWEKFTIPEEEWFAAREPSIASIKGKSRRGKEINSLFKTNPFLYAEWHEALRIAEAYSLVLSKKSGLYPLTGSGELNTYHLFAEHAEQIVDLSGRVGLVVKTGIASANNCLPFFRKLTNNQQLVSLFDFVNTLSLFPAVQTVERFSLITYKGQRGGVDSSKFATLCRDLADLAEPNRQYSLTPQDIALMSPLNGACPMLKGLRDGEIMRRIYRNFHILASKDLNRPEEFWNLTYVRIFDMANDSRRFLRKEELEDSGLVMDQLRRFISKDEQYWPLYEGKYIFLFDSRYGTFENVPADKRYGRKATAPTPRVVQLQKNCYEIIPRYWFPYSLWLERCKEVNLREDYQFHFRDVAGVYPDLRTAIGAICQAGPAGDKAPVLVLKSVGNNLMDAKRYLSFTALFCSIPFDYLVRNKLFSKSLKFNVLGQIPIPSPSLVIAKDGDETWQQNYLQKLAFELSFTSWGLFALGEALHWPFPFIWNEERRFLMLREIDALAAYFYGLNKVELEYIISTFQSLERNEVIKYGSFRTKELVMASFDRIIQSINTGEPYQIPINPPPGPPMDAAGNFISIYKWDRNHWPVHIHPTHPRWEESLLSAWFNVCQKRWNHIEDEQVFPWIGREAFVYSLIPYLVQEKPGEKFEFYRDAALLASRSNRCETLLLNEDLRKKYHQAMQSLDWLGFPDQHRIRPRKIRESLQKKNIIQTKPETGATIVCSEVMLPPLPQELKQLLPLILQAADNLDNMQRIALEDSEAGKITFKPDQVANELKMFIVA